MRSTILDNALQHGGLYKLVESIESNPCVNRRFSRDWRRRPEIPSGMAFRAFRHHDEWILNPLEHRDRWRTLSSTDKQYGVLFALIIGKLEKVAKSDLPVQLAALAAQDVGLETLVMALVEHDAVTMDTIYAALGFTMEGLKPGALPIQALRGQSKEHSESATESASEPSEEEGDPS